MKIFYVSADYLLWAHGPGAESGQALAAELCTRAEYPNRRGQAAIPADRLDLVFEIISVAELYPSHRKTPAFRPEIKDGAAKRV